MDWLSIVWYSSGHIMLCSAASARTRVSSAADGRMLPSRPRFITIYAVAV